MADLLNILNALKLMGYILKLACIIWFIMESWLKHKIHLSDWYAAISRVSDDVAK